MAKKKKLVTKKKKVAKRTVEPEKPKVVTPIVEKMPDLKAAEQLRNNAKTHFGNMQRSWYLFARSVHEIRETDSFRALGFKDFKEFCSKEYPSVNYVTISKFVAIVEGFGKILDSKVKDPDFALPAYESCYRLLTVEKKVPEVELEKLRKKVFEAKLSYMELQEELKRHLDKSHERDEREVEEIEKELSKDLGDDDDGFMPGREVEDDLDEMAEEDDDDSNDAENLSNKVKFLLETLPELTKKVKKDREIDDGIIELAENLDTLNKLVDEFLTTVEEVSNE